MFENVAASICKNDDYWKTLLL